jgi:release factor glutamine methyltransferase
MIIEFSKDLKKQKIYAHGQELVQILGRKINSPKDLLLSNKKFIGTIKNPVLATDLYAMVKQLKNNIVRDTIFALYQNYPRIIEYNKVSVWWNPLRHKNVWCPSIDTVLFAKALNKISKSTFHPKSVIEIGCGSGFLGKYAAKTFSSIKKAIFVDINPFAILCVKDNTKDLRIKKEFFTSRWQNIKRGDKYDLIICNPPYLPRPQSIDKNPYEGISLMREIILSGKNYLNKGGLIVINYSSLCEKEAKNFIKQSGFKSRILIKMKVPLKVLPVLNNKEWMRFLYKRAGLKKEPYRGYIYWQTLNIVELKNE